MEQGITLDRRTSRDRRTDGTYLYTGPERRSLRDRRSGRITICIFCEEICGDLRGWIKGSLPIETAAECLIDVCTDCSSKRFTQFYTKTKSLEQLQHP